MASNHWLPHGGGWAWPVGVAYVSATPPALYPLVPAGQCGATVTVGCLAWRYFPQSVTFSWAGTVGGVNETFPANQDAEGLYSRSSVLTADAAAARAGAVTCRLQHPPTDTAVEKTIEGICPEPVTVKLLSDPNHDDPAGVLLLCLVEGSGAGQAEVQWLENHKALEVQQEVTSCSSCSGPEATYSSRVNVSRQSWDLGATFSCRVSHPSLQQPQVLNVSTFCSDHPKLEVTLSPPPLEDLLLKQRANLTCEATNIPAPGAAILTWSRNDDQSLQGTTGPPQELPNGFFRLTGTLELCADEWTNGDSFSCNVTLPQSGQSVLEEIRKEPAASLLAPSVYIFPPPADQLAREETVTLTCLANRFLPRDIVVTWTCQDQPVAAGAFATFGPVAVGGAFSVYSQLEVEAADWQKGVAYSCVIGHEAVPLKFIQKTVDKSVGRPTAVNVSVIMADSDVTCY